VRIASLYVRFFRSFNFDYLRKAHPGSTPSSWDEIEGRGFFPFVEIGLEPDITTIVGANESGKSQLLAALKCALTGAGIEASDFCRYSEFFAVDHQMAKPEFGLHIVDIEPEERDRFASSFGLAAPLSDSLWLFRFAGERPVVFLSQSGATSVALVGEEEEIGLPHWFEIDSKTPLPDSVSIEALASGSADSGFSRSRVRSAIRSFIDSDPRWFESAETVTQSAKKISAAMSPMGRGSTSPAEFKLAEDLLVRIAGIDRSAFTELAGAVTNGNEGYANGIVEQFNRQLSDALNFPRWWSQDQQFKLLVSLRDLDLVFTIMDRTGTEYSFGERSGGLRYFLSYFVQHLSHQWPTGGFTQMLLMDEPDAYLSSLGQQDLLKIFTSFVEKAAIAGGKCQVVFVTHSPFLIDKNHGERIRVLEKGADDEGTRVVHNAAKNHYEPLRSAFGAFVGETAFIGNANLMMEGISDQVFIAGMSSRLRRRGVPSLDLVDLNSSTLVPAGSASHIPYMVFLATGRDVERPAIVVVLDSDTAGDSAKKVLLKGGPYQKRLLAPEFILQLGDLPKKSVRPSSPGVTDIEDLVPEEILLAALDGYAREFLGDVAEEKLAGGTRVLSFGDVGNAHEALETYAQSILGSELHLDKLALARHVLEAFDSAPGELEAARETMVENFRTLLAAIAVRQRSAMRELRVERTGSRIRRLQRGFLRDHEVTATREEAVLLLEEIESTLVPGFAAEELRAAVRLLRLTHQLDQDVTGEIEDFEAFKSDLENLAYIEVLESAASTLTEGSDANVSP
jgi:predicted ATPase